VTDLVRGAEQLADLLTDSLDDSSQRIGYLEVLDALASCRLTLTEDDHQASRAYAESADLEKSLAES
jgi:hypothetical protein